MIFIRLVNLVNLEDADFNFSILFKENLFANKINQFAKIALLSNFHVSIDLRSL